MTSKERLRVEIGKLSAEYAALRAACAPVLRTTASMVKAAFMEGIDCGYPRLSDSTRETLWDQSAAKKSLDGV